jgi:hypothetical protein
VRVRVRSMYTTKDTREAQSHIHTQSNTHKRQTDKQETRDQKQQTNNPHEKKPKKTTHNR